jgi:antitoxin (DNA-binding transcriptional repressor) of toxin-antitoxin stability system
VAAGEDIVITVDGHPVALLLPLRPRSRWISRADLLRRLRTTLTDPDGPAEQKSPAAETADDPPW